MTNAYSDLIAKNQEISLLHSTGAVLDWDQETNLTSKSQAYRAEQLAYITGKAHELSTSQAYASALAHAEDAGANNISEEANLREWRHSYNQATCLTQELVERDSKASSLAKSAWTQARETSNFSLFAPHLDTLLSLAKEKAELWGYEDEAYDALLSNYERGAKTKDIVTIFDSLEPQIITLASDAVAKSAQNKTRKFDSPFPIESQKILNREVAESFGFDFEAGRIDTTTHPFCSTLGPDDIRLTTRYYLQDFTTSLFGVLHETGHGLYEQGLPSSDFGLPTGNAISLGIHESQSLLWEAHVGRSRAFWQHWLPRAKELFPQLSDWSLDAFLCTINQANYSTIRVDADEATYDLHILLRFKLERQLLNGEITVNDIPAAWNEAFEKSFNMRPENDTQGCLQDIHWAMGGLGYFPTYTMGNLNASQLFQAACKDSAVSDAFQKANFRPLLEWMRTNIHAHGSTYLPQDLMLKASGERTNPEHHLAHLRQRFL